jgi:hypothetical protein
MYTALEYSTRVVQEGDRRCKKSTLNDFCTPDPSKNTFNEPATYLEGMAAGSYKEMSSIFAHQ